MNIQLFKFFIVAYSCAAAGAAYPPAARDVVEFQPSKLVQPSVAIGEGRSAQLINLNREIGGWYLLNITAPGRAAQTFNIEKTMLPESRNISLTGVDAEGLILSVDGQRKSCALFAAGSPLWTNAGASYLPICDGQLWLRSARGLPTAPLQAINGGPPPAPGLSSAEAVIASAALRSRADLRPSGSASPRAAWLTPVAQGRAISVASIGIELAGQVRGALRMGEWTPAARADGVFVTSFQPGLAAPEIMNSYRDRVGGLESSEAFGNAVFVAFDLTKHSIGWTSGTGRPGVGWSSYPGSVALRNPALAGPDGFATTAPLALPGILNPAYLPKLAAIMAGGFQRFHGVVQHGRLAQVNNGSYFGFIENGVVLSRLNSGLATLTADINGRVDIRTWSDEDQPRMQHIVHARQNNPPIIDGIDANGMSTPGSLVNSWGGGAWSGQASSAVTHSPRSMRSGVCIAEHAGSRHLIYGYFPMSNPNGMARAFQALRCSHAMHLDMNNPAWAYLGLLTGSGRDSRVELADSGMASANSLLESEGARIALPRAVGKHEGSDFFYIIRNQ